MSAPQYTSRFTHVNGIRLHFLDWGGTGPTMCFLTGLGLSAFVYAGFAARFSGAYRVIALTRRGHGDSDYPETGYDVDTLTEDLREFLDSLNLDRVVLVGHSLAGVELGHFTALYPHRVLALVYLDAAYDGPKCKVAMEANPLKDVEPPDAKARTTADYIRSLKGTRPDLAEIWSPLLDEETERMVRTTPEGHVVDRMPDAVARALMATYLSYSIEEPDKRVPVLSIYAMHEDYALHSPDYLTPEQQALNAKHIREVHLPYQRECIEQFRQLMPQARIVVIPDGHHYCFIKHEALVFDEMTRFLGQAL